jgi:glycosyltransferase involved in cell wall biosynthesis
MHISIVVPLYNEEAVILYFHKRLTVVLNELPHDCDVWYVDDGSADRTASLVRQIMEADSRVHLLELSRNFGHQVALTAGLDHADGDVVITMDGDGQHPPELLPQLLALYEEGYDLVLTQRHTDRDRTLLKRWVSHGFYWLINHLSQTYILPNSADFRLMSRDVVDGLRQVRERHRCLRGIVTWMGFPWTVLHFEEEPRIAGRPKYSWRKLLQLATDAIFSFSTTPLKLAIWIGLILLFLAALEVGWVLYLIITGRRGELPTGWASVILGVMAIGGMQLIILGLLGQYIGFIFQEVKKRPLYFLKRRPRRSARIEAGKPTEDDRD